MTTATQPQPQTPKPTTVRVTGAEAVLLALVAEGVETIFGYPGGAIMPIYDALYGYEDRLRHILTRHEQGAVHAAQGYARVTGRPGVCFATSGPGATNLITGIADAHIDSTPLVCVTGQVASSLLGTDAFQETDVVGISMPVTKWNHQITSADEVAEVMARAFYVARNGRPGPVLIDITKDAQFGETDFAYRPCEGIRSYAPYPAPAAGSLEAAAALIDAAQKPYLLVGQGVLISGAQAELRALVEKAGVPVASTLLGLSAFPADHPLYVGYLGMHGNYGCNVLTNECDLLIAVGMRFDDRVTGDLKRYARQAKVIHVEIDPAEIDKNVKTTVAVNADARAALAGLLPLVRERRHDAWLAEFKRLDAVEWEKVVGPALHRDEGGIRMSEVIHHLSELTDGQAVVVTDVGQHQQVTSRYYRYRGTLTNVTSGGLGTMGFALPAALGAKLGRPDKEVIAVIGDGGFQMTLQELGTIFQYKIGVKVVILNNSFLGMVRQWQQLFFDRRYSSTEMVNPDFVKLAEAFSITAARVEARDALVDALKTMRAHQGSYLLEVVVEKEENVFPMVPSGASVSDIRLE
ncbi:MAG: biosynthetic-type acetolactate synthase large subunit [Catalinimonas sp.]